MAPAWAWALAIAAAATLASTVISILYHRWVERRFPPEGAFIEVDGVRTHYVRRGPRDAPTLLMLHGLNGFLQDFTHTVVDELAVDHDVVVLERPGYGHTARPRPELSDPRIQADWIVRVLDALGIEDPLVVGHSWGGGLAMTMAVRHPDRVPAMVLVAPYAFPGTEPDDWIHGLPRLPRARHLLARTFLVPGLWIAGRFFVRAAFDPDPVPPGYLSMWNALTARPRHFVTTMEEIRTIDPALAAVMLEYGDVAAPMTVVAGTRDRSVDHRANAQRLAEVLDHADVVLLDDVGHMVPWSQPDVVVAAIRDRAAGLSPTGS